MATHQYLCKGSTVDAIPAYHEEQVGPQTAVHVSILNKITLIDYEYPELFCTSYSIIYDLVFLPEHYPEVDIDIIKRYRYKYLSRFPQVGKIQVSSMKGIYKW